MGKVGKPTPQVFRGKGEQTDEQREQLNIWTPSSKKSKCAEQEFGENSKGGVPTPTIVGTDLSRTGGLKQLECVMLSSYRGRKSQNKGAGRTYGSYRRRLLLPDLERTPSFFDRWPLFWI